MSTIHEIFLDTLIISLNTFRGCVSNVTKSLLQAALRGDGTAGEDVTMAASHMLGLPAAAKPPQGLTPSPDATTSDGDFSVRGEVYISKADFGVLNARRAEAGQPLFANARNAASGSVRLLDAREVEKRLLRFIAFELIYPTPPTSPAPTQTATSIKKPRSSDSKQTCSADKASDSSSQKADDSVSSEVIGGVTPECGSVSAPRVLTQHRALEVLRDMGFECVLGNSAVAQGLDRVIDATRLLQDRRDELPYEVDGCVIKVNNLQVRCSE